MRNIVLTVAISLFASQAFAIGMVSSAKVTAVRVDGTGKAMVFFDTPIGGTPPSCVHPSYKNAYAFDANTAGGKAALSWALAARTTGALVHAYGLGVCGVYGTNIVEQFDYGQF